MIGPTTIAAFGCSAGLRRRWRAAPIGAGARISLHGHDWHAGLAPAYLAAEPPAGERVPTVFTIHNLAYRGLFPAALFPDLALPPELLFDRRGRVFRDGVVSQGRDLLRRPADHGQPDLCARDPDPGLRLGSRRAVAQPRRRIDRDPERRRSAHLGPPHGRAPAKRLWRRGRDGGQARGENRAAEPPRARSARGCAAIWRGKPPHPAKGPRPRPRRLAGPAGGRRPAGLARLRAMPTSSTPLLWRPCSTEAGSESRSATTRAWRI